MKTTIEQIVELLNESLGDIPEKKVLTEATQEVAPEKEISLLEAIEKITK